MLQTGTMIIGRGGASDAVREGISEETMRACCKLLRKIPAGLLAIALAASCCRLKEEWTAFVGGTTISVRAGAGRIVSGRPAGELTSGKKVVATARGYGQEWTLIWQKVGRGAADYDGGAYA